MNSFLFFQNDAFIKESEFSLMYGKEAQSRYFDQIDDIQGKVVLQ